MTVHDHSAKKPADASSGRVPHHEQHTPDTAWLTDDDDMQLAAGYLRPETLTPQTIIQLQRTIGNQAVMRLLERQNHTSRQSDLSHAPDNLIHRYTGRTATNPEMQDWVGKFQRSSANGGILQISEQNLVARNEVIDTSEQALAAQGSAVQLVKGEEFSPGYSRVKVKVRDSRIGDLTNDRGVKDPRVQALGQHANSDPGVKQKLLVESLIAAIKNNEHSIELNKAAISLKQSGSDSITPEEIEAIGWDLGAFKNAGVQDMQDENTGRQQSNKNMQAELEKLMKHKGHTDMFMTIRDCHMTARLIMGDLGRGPSAVWKEKGLTSNPDGSDAVIDTARAPKNQMNTVGNLAAFGLLKHAYGTFDGVLENYVAHPPESVVVSEDDRLFITGIIERIRSVRATPMNYDAAMSLYGDIQGHAKVGPLFNKTYSINEFAKVAVGQALVQVNDETEYGKSNSGALRDEKDQRIDLWNFHWAGVVLMDGSDYVTLEAVADAAASGLTTEWTFKMYGTGEQSFHSENKKDPHVGERPLTMGIAAPKPR